MSKTAAIPRQRRRIEATPTTAPDAVELTVYNSVIADAELVFAPEDDGEQIRIVIRRSEDVATGQVFGRTAVL